MDALSGATVIDVVSGRSIADGVVLVRDGHVEAVGSADEIEIPRGATITDLRGHWIIPGLIDAHTHLQPWGLGVALRYGVTAVRDLADRADLADSLRAAAARGPAPHLYIGLAVLDSLGSFGPTHLDTTSVALPDSVAGRIASLLAQHANWASVSPRVTPAQLESILASARVPRLPVAAQLGVTDALTAAHLGVASIESLSGIPEAAGDSTALFATDTLPGAAGWTAFERSWSSLDTAALGDVVRELAARRLILVPMLVLHEARAHFDDSTRWHDPSLAAVPDSAQRSWELAALLHGAKWADSDFAAFRAARPLQDFAVHTFVTQGGRVATGSDASRPMLVPGAGVHDEMGLLVRAGLAPIDALRAATEWGADLLRADSLGRLRPGAVADLVVLDADPLQSIANSRRISRVMRAGRWLPR
ncbi:MAG TPA: amidohydrolase family protein [Gemmatimonadales bacterium]|jgi:imidazolonepropionase-like amidohydrolase